MRVNTQNRVPLSGGALKPLLFLIVALMVSCAPNTSTAETGVVHRVIDGDTIVTKGDDGKLVSRRLAAIDTPETYRSTKARRDAGVCGINLTYMTHLGLEAKEYLQDTLPKGTIIEYDVVDVGRYKRPIIWIEGVTPGIIMRGLATVEDYRNVDTSIMSKLISLENTAKEHKLGIWRYFKTKCM